MLSMRVGARRRNRRPILRTEADEAVEHVDDDDLQIWPFGYGALLL
jgi:hypothetical protein